MADILSVLVRNAVQASLLIAGILLIRAMLKKRLSPRASYALWLLPALRLLLPFDVESPLSLMRLFPVNDAASGTAVAQASNAVSALAPVSPQTAVQPLAPAVSNVVTAAPTAPVEVITAPAAQALSDGELLLLIWLIGAFLALAYIMIVNAHFFTYTKKLRERVDVDCILPVYRVPMLASPCLAGVFRPYILLNDAALSSKSVLSFALTHEMAHYKRGDHIAAFVRSFICCVYWFAPPVWLAAYLCGRDCELACDSYVMRSYTMAQRESYGMALISLICRSGATKPFIAATSMSGGARELKQRIAYIGKAERKSRSTVLIAVALSLILCAAACTAAPTSDGTLFAGDSPAVPVVSAPPSAANTDAASGSDGEVVSSFPSLAVVYTDDAGSEARRELNIGDDAVAQELLDRCVFDHLVRSAAWQAVNVAEYMPYIDITQVLVGSDTETNHYYVFLMDGRPCFQSDNDGMWTIMSDAVCAELCAFMRGMGDPAFDSTVEYFVANGLLETAITNAILAQDGASGDENNASVEVHDTLLVEYNDDGTVSASVVYSFGVFAPPSDVTSNLIIPVTGIRAAVAKLTFTQETPYALALASFETPSGEASQYRPSIRAMFNESICDKLLAAQDLYAGSQNERLSLKAAELFSSMGYVDSTVLERPVTDAAVLPTPTPAPMPTTAAEATPTPSVTIEVEHGASYEGTAPAPATDPTPTPMPTPALDSAEYSETAAAQAVRAATDLIGTPYNVDGEGPDSFSPAGFVRYCLSMAGETAPQGNSADMAENSGFERIDDISALRAGDILYFGDDDRGIFHCAIYIGDGAMIHASSSKGSVERYNLSTYFTRHFVFAQRWC